MWDFIVAASKTTAVVLGVMIVVESVENGTLVIPIIRPAPKAA